MRAGRWCTVAAGWVGVHEGCLQDRRCAVPGSVGAAREQGLEQTVHGALAARKPGIEPVDDRALVDAQHRAAGNTQAGPETAATYSTWVAVR
jgi:hypothetical protein